MLKYRTLTAIVLLIIIFAMMWWLPPLPFAILISVFFIISAQEWSKLLQLRTKIWRLVYVCIVIIGLVIAYFLPPLPLFYVALLLWLWAAAAIISYQREAQLLGFQWLGVKALTGILMLVFCWKAVVLLKTASPVWLFLALALIWLVDTGGYFSGRHWGNHALANRISPKKTWEGFWGGVLLAVAAIAIAGLFLPITPAQKLLFIPMAFVCVIFAVIGDLFVSLLKRQAGLKDTGNLLPGHGGLLDRVDSTISAAPIFALGYLLLKL